MRDFKGMKRQRNRGRGGGGGGKPQHNANRAFDSNGPDGVKVRGAAQHIYEKYQQLARDAGSAGDRVLAENYLQHAEHYFRVLRAMQPQRPVGEIIGRDQFGSGYDIDFEEEPGPTDETSEQPEVEAQGEQRRDERPFQRDDRFQQGQQGEYRPREDRGDFRRDDRDFRRDDRGQGEYRQKDDRFQGDRRERFQRDDRRFQGDRQARPDRDYRDARPERDMRPDRGERLERDPLGVIEPQASPIPSPQAPVSPAPTNFDAREEPGGVLRSEDGAVSHAPAFLQPRPEIRPEGDEEPGRRPRRRRPPRSFDAGQADAAEADEG
jgi:hypothetical protein